MVTPITEGRKRGRPRKVIEGDFTSGAENPNIVKPSGNGGNDDSGETEEASSSDDSDSDEGVVKDVRASKSGKLTRAQKRKAQLEHAEQFGDEGDPNQVEESADPLLFEEMEIERNIKLENRAKKLAVKRDDIKAYRLQEKGLEEECLRIMEDAKIRVYNKFGVHLEVKDKLSLIVNLE